MPRGRVTAGQRNTGLEGRVTVVFWPLLCDGLMPGVTWFVCVTKHAENKHIPSNALEPEAGMGHLAFKSLSCCKGELVPV